MKRKILTFMLATLFILSAAACSNEDSDGPVTLEILLSDDSLEGGAMAHMVEKFNEEFADQGIQAEINEIAYADLPTQLQNRATANELPALVKTTGFDDIKEYIHPLNDSELSQDMFYLDGTREDTFYSTTINTTAVGMIINKTLFDEAGVSYPLAGDERWTWTEFRDAVQTVVDNTDAQYGFVMDHSQQRISTFLYQFGAAIYDPDDMDHVVFRSDETREAVDFLLDMYDSGLSPASVGTGTENAQSTFKTGTVAAHFSGNWVLNDYNETITDFEWTPVLAPYEETPATSLGGNWFFAMDGTGMEEESVTFLEWFYQPENYTEYCEIGNYLPGRSGIEPNYSVEGLDVFNQELNDTTDQPNYDTSVGYLHSGESWGNAIRDAIDRAIAGELDTEGVLDYVVNEITSNVSNKHE